MLENLTWRLLRSGPADPATNMATDELLLEGVSALGTPVLRFYGWSRPAASFGYLQKIAEVEASTDLRPLVRRPTAGGVVPHQGDWTYSLALPPHHEWWRLRALQSSERLHQWILASLQAMGVTASLAQVAAKQNPLHCFAGPDPLDLVTHGTKLAGAAQRRNRLGLLIQGSLQPPRHLNRSAWEANLLQTGRTAWNIEFQEWHPPESWADEVARRARNKFGSESFLRRR